MRKRKISLLTPTILISFFIIALVFTFLPKNPAPKIPLTSSNISSNPKSSFFSLLTSRPTSHLQPPTSLIAVGDIMLGRYVNVKMLQYNDFKYPFLKTASFTSNADITFGNLEAPIVADCPTTETGMIFCARPEAIAGLKFGGFDVLSIANNHILNYGQKGLDQTKLLLNKNSILYSPLSSSNFSSNNQNNLTIKQLKNLRFGFLSFNLTQTSTFDNDRYKWLKAISDNKESVDILIVSLHWGNEYQKSPTEAQKELAHQIIDSGAKIIIGHHPHVTQPTESYHNGLIFYSLGNFIFDQPWSEETKKGNIAKIIFEGKEIKSYEIIPVYIENSSQPNLLTQ